LQRNLATGISGDINLENGTEIEIEGISCLIKIKKNG